MKDAASLLEELRGLMPESEEVDQALGVLEEYGAMDAEGEDMSEGYEEDGMLEEYDDSEDEDSYDDILEEDADEEEEEEEDYL